jgi:hypothetical protein
VQAASEVPEQDETVGDRAVSRERRDQTLVRARADRVNRGDHTAAPGDLERLEQLGQPFERFAR